MKSILIITLSLVLNVACAGAEKINTSYFSGVAIDGYDVVAYHTEEAAIAGKDEFKATYKNATWKFSSEDNRKLFLENPEHYLPQYGGYCAYAVSKGSTADIDPTIFALVNGKLYLNYNKSVGEKWEKNKEKYIPLADKNWKQMTQ
tara:strand:- start:185223 stop:185660 length:438 start_codon:yes stop_codon:yes gene_type:complete